MKKLFIYSLFLSVIISSNCSFFGRFFSDDFYDFEKEINQAHNNIHKIEREFTNGEISTINHNGIGFSFDEKKEELILRLPESIEITDISSFRENKHVVIKIQKDYFNLGLVIFENGYQVQGSSEIKRKNDHGYAASSSQISQSNTVSYKIDLSKISIDISDDGKNLYVLLPKNLNEQSSDIKITKRSKSQNKK